MRDDLKTAEKMFQPRTSHISDSRVFLFLTFEDRSQISEFLGTNSLLQENTNFSSNAIELQQTFQLDRYGVCNSLTQLEVRNVIIISLC